MNEWKYLNGVKKKYLKNEFEIRKINPLEYHKLSKFHYINTNIPSGRRQCFGLYHNEILYGVVLYAMTSLELTARHKTILGKFLSRFKDKRRRCQVLNKNTMCISRLVMHPSIRGIGAASRLIEETWRKLGVRFVEGFGYMAYYRNFHPKSYSYYIKVERVVSANDFLNYKSDKGAMIHRLKSPIMKYGYVLYINENIKISL